MDPRVSRGGALRGNHVIDARYRVLKTLGEGGMGTVYLAEHTLIKRRVAVKVLHPELAADSKIVDRFMAEARAAGTLGHPHIVESTDMGFMDGAVPYIVFEYLEGTLLTDEVHRLGAVPVRRAVTIAQQIASALHAAHTAGIIHRDLKTDNVFLTDRGDGFDHVKVLDFGISKFLQTGADERTRRGMIMGTPEFLAPEQITSPDEVDERSDVYALGVILYEMLAGRRPFTGADPRTLLHRIVHTAPPPIERPEVPRGLLDLVYRLLDKDPDGRIQTMTDVEAVLDLYATQSDTAQRRAGRPSSRGGLDEQASAMHMAQQLRGRRAPTPVAARPSSQISRVASRETPWPDGGGFDSPSQMMMVSQVAPAPARPPWVLYVLVACGVIVGGVGLWVGLRRPDAPRVAQAPPVVTPAPAAAAAPAPAAAVPAAAAAVQKIDIVIDADAPGARVTFRRRLAAVPFTLQVAPNDIVELVEVSAPGRKTVRYWLTLDRPTTLHAKLPKGAGNLEATEEETLIALGEAVQLVAAAPEPVKEVAPVKREKAVAPAPPPASSRTSRPARRIGKAAEPPPEPAVAVAAAPAPAPAPAPAAPAAAPIELTPAVATTPAPAPAPPPAPAIAKAAPAADPPAAAPAPKPIDPGTIDKAVVAQVMAKNRPAVVACYQQAKKSKPGLEGTVTVAMTVDAKGALSRPQVNSTLGVPQVAACILKAMKTWKFPARPGGSAASATYKFALQ